jgi:ubiquinone/menaquinone biosynthesis C-methylase UbiE
MRDKQHWELIREVCPPGGAVIDVGGGTSVLAHRLMELGYSVVVLDISEMALARSREHLGQH